MSTAGRGADNDLLEGCGGHELSGYSQRVVD